MRRRSFRFRVALHFAGFGALLSLLLCVGVYVFAHDLGQRLMDETLQAEMQDYLARLERNPKAPLPFTLTLGGYVLDGGDGDAAVPPVLHTLASGKHDIIMDGLLYRAMASERHGKRYVFLFNESLQQQREQTFVLFLAVGALVMTLLAALGGFWLARRVVAPVTALAARVGAASPLGEVASESADSSLDEVEELALVFDRTLAGIQSCMARERDFTSNVSHELRTPLAIIRGAVEVLEEDAALNPGQRQRLARIERASRDMADLTGALLHLARKESTLTGENESCDVADVVRESIEKYRALNRDRPLDITMDIPQNFSLSVARILAVVVVDNLVSNAFQHAGSSAARIDMRLEPDRLVIRDTGSGIAASDLREVFQRHYRGTNSTGSGIGLSLVKRVCDLNGWETRIESASGQGTTVSLLFRPESVSS
ncbi:MAG: HAMP domain-containing sensor histidine kinase [Gallionellaceae bacterium]|nr:HAMP domain-containing sensor histidine kinase [Gallionellaceae bacterium]